MASNEETAASGRLEPGHVIAGRYVVERLIGSGGMGEVYAAKDGKLERTVALKVVKLHASSKAKRRLEAEAKAVASLEHAGIVTLHDVVEDGDAIVLVMELVSGTSLREMLVGGPLPPRAVSLIVRGVADALTAAHARGLVHRDVKPDNVIVRKDGRTALLDFGVARLIRTDSGEADLAAATVTADGVVVGTPAYLAPEQARGEDVSPATDQFALAVTAYELLLGRSPWPAVGIAGIVAAILSTSPRPIPGFGEAREPLDEVFARALAKAPADRFESVDAFASALEVVLEGASEDPGVAFLSSANVTISNDRKLVGATQVLRLPSASTPSSREKASKSRPAPAASPRDRGGKISLLLLALVLATAFAVGLWIVKERKRTTSDAGSSGSAAGEKSSPVDAVDVSAGATEVERAWFREALASFRRGDIGAARTRMDQTLAANPGFASGALFRAYLSFVLAAQLDEPGRAAFRNATAHADQLSRRDAEFLTALTPSFLDPPKWRETTTRLEAIIAAAPTDTRAFEALGFARVKLGDDAASEQAFKSELALDRRAVFAHDLIAQIYDLRGDPAAAKKELGDCIRDEPSSARCRGQLALMLADDGECAHAERDARDALALDPKQQGALIARARAASGLGAAADVVAVLLADRVSTLPPDRVAAQEIEDKALLALRIGDFPTALAALDVGESAEDSRFLVARVETLLEMGELDRAGEAASKYLARAATRRLPERPWDDATGRMLTVLRASGRISAEERQKRREAWIADWRGRETDAEWQFATAKELWAQAYAPIGDATEEDGRVAKEAATRLRVPLTPRGIVNRSELPNTEELYGVLLAVTAPPEVAEAFVSSLTRACHIGKNMRAFLLLGQLATKKGDKAAACAAYAEIEKAWRDAKPKSVSLERARAARTELRCEAER